MSVRYATYLSRRKEFLGEGRFNFVAEIELDKDGFMSKKSLDDLIHEVKNKMTGQYLSESEKEGLRMLLNFLERNRNPA